MANKKKTYKIIVSLLVAAMLALGLSGCKEEKTNLGSSEPFTVDTPFATIACPGSDMGAVYSRIQDGTKYTVKFYGKIGGDTEYHLFDIWFSNSEEQSVGRIKTKDDTEVYVGVTVYPLENDENHAEAETNAVYAMQELLNSILENFIWVESNQQSSETEPLFVEDIVIDTPYIPLTYPGKWKDMLFVEEYADGAIHQVEFYGMLPEKDTQHLFTIQFGVEGDGKLGVVYDENGEKVPVNLILGVFIPDEEWTDEEKQTIYAMQEDLNSLIDNLTIELD
jgi:hypothetical protein